MKISTNLSFTNKILVIFDGGKSVPKRRNQFRTNHSITKVIFLIFVYITCPNDI